MKLTDFVVGDAIITEIKATEKEAVIREMVCSLKDPEISYEKGGIGKYRYREGRSGSSYET